MGLFSSKSSSASHTTNNNYDQKNQVAEGGTGVSASGNARVTLTDQGAVGKAFDFAALLSQGAASERAASSASTTQMAQSAMQSVQSAYKDVGTNLASAYEGAKAGEQKIMVAAALALVALVAIKLIGKAS